MNTKMIGSKIAKVRKDKKMSQAQLAQLLFISPQAVGKWERGESTPDIVTINRLAEILALDLNYFSENNDYPLADEQVTRTGHVDSNAGQAIPAANETPATTERQLLTNFSGANFSKSDFSGVIAHKRKFNGSALAGADFSGADLTGSSFSGSDIRAANFDGANLTDCTLSGNDLSEASFKKTILIRTTFSASGLEGAKFINAELVNAKLAKTDLRKTIFENCVFKSVDFKYADLREVNLGGQTFIDVRFDSTALTEAIFSGSTLRNVSFRPSYALTNKYYKAIKTIHFDGATMDKLTYAELKSLGADLSKVTTV